MPDVVSGRPMGTGIARETRSEMRYLEGIPIWVMGWTAYGMIAHGV